MPLYSAWVRWAIREGPLSCMSTVRAHSCCWGLCLVKLNVACDMVTWTPLDPVETALFLTDRVRCFGTSGGATEEEVRDLVSELKILIYVGEHKNIVNLLGACIKRDRILVILEYAPHGSLQKFLQGKRDVYEATWTTTASDPEIRLNISNLVGYAYQISRGMEYLASKKVIFPHLRFPHCSRKFSSNTSYSQGTSCL